MKSIKPFIFLALVLFYSVTIHTTAQESAPYLALITSLDGNVMLKKAGKTDFVKALWGTQLTNGDQIRTGADSKVTLTFSNSTVMKVEPNSTITISTNSPASTQPVAVKKVSSAMIGSFSSITSKRAERKDAGALAGLRSVGIEQPIDPTSPYNTLIKTTRPDFTWIPKKPYDKFVVNLYSSKGLVWSKKVAETTLKFPQSEKGLDFGETYFWNVEGEDLLDNDKSPSYKFSILTADKTKEVLDQEALIRMTFSDDSDSSSLHSFLGAYYMSQGLLQDAINEFVMISRMNPDAPLPHEILGSLYSDAGDKDKAIEELQKALAMSKNEKEK